MSPITPKQVLYWIAEFEDGAALPQYDPETGKEYAFKEVDQGRLLGLALIPFTPELAKLTGNLCNPFLPIIRIRKQEKTDRLIHFRRQNIAYGSHTKPYAMPTVYGLGIEGKFVLFVDSQGNLCNWYGGWGS